MAEPKNLDVIMISVVHTSGAMQKEMRLKRSKRQKQEALH